MHYAFMGDESDRLKRARIEAGFSRTEAAKRLGLRYSTYAAHENGSRGFNKGSARHYAAAFKVNAQWLLYGLGEPKGRSIEQTILSFPPEYQREIQEYIEFISGKVQTHKKAS
jgi:DNA-binding XRE family transcriptional regulator